MAGTQESVQPAGDRQAGAMARVVHRNIAALLQRRHAEDQARSHQDRIADAITSFTGSMRSVWLHLASFGTWIVVNLGWTPLPVFDPTFVALAMVASVEAIFLSTFVLITQNRQSAQADRRADLDLQISLLAEHEITRLIKLVGALADRAGIETSADPELPELERDVAPEQIMDVLDASKARGDAS